MKLLAAAIRAYNDGDDAKCDATLEAARALSGLDATAFTAWATTAALCDRLTAAELVDLITPQDDVQADMVAAVAKQLFDTGDSDCVTLANLLTGFGSRFKVLALRCAATFNTLHSIDLSAYPPRVIHRAAALLDRHHAAHLIGQATLCSPHFAEQGPEAVQELIAVDELHTAVRLAEELVERRSLQRHRIAELGANAAIRLDDRVTAEQLARHASDSGQLRIAASLDDTEQSWQVALEASASDGAFSDSDYVDTLLAAAALEEHLALLFDFACRRTLTDPDAALRLSQVLDQHGRTDLALAVVDKSDHPQCLFQTADLTYRTDVDAALAICRPLAQRRDADPAVLLSACRLLARHGARPVGTLVAVVNNTAADLPVRFDGAELLAELVENGAPAGHATGQALTVAGVLAIGAGNSNGYVWLRAAGRAGHQPAVSQLLAFRGDPAFCLHATVALADIAAHAGRSTDLLSFAASGYRMAVEAGNKRIAEHCRSLLAP